MYLKNLTLLGFKSFSDKTSLNFQPGVTAIVGPNGRKPMGMAEVSLTLGDMDQDHLRASGVEMAYNEATITRRIFRDGNSEYFINRTSCRLKDIQQLFMGTGVGRTSYSILAQGHITQILSSKPEDRRVIFEEAAGITKF